MHLYLAASKRSARHILGMLCLAVMIIGICRGFAARIFGLPFQSSSLVATIVFVLLSLLSLTLSMALASPYTNPFLFGILVIVAVASCFDATRYV